MNDLSFDKFAEELGLNVCRLVVLLEVEPNSNKYQQILFTKEKFKALSGFLWKDLPKVHDPDTLKEYGEITCGGEDYMHLREDLKDFYDKDDPIWKDE